TLADLRKRHKRNTATGPVRTSTLHANRHPARSELVGVLVLRDQRHRRLEKNVEIEQHRPVLDVIEVELDALLDLFLVVDLAAPAVDLRPAGDAGFDAMAGEITVDRFVEQLRQFVEAGLADEASDPGDAAVVLGHDFRRQRIGLVMVERAELEDVDALIVEAE